MAISILTNTASLNAQRNLNDAGLARALDRPPVVRYAHQQGGRRRRRPRHLREPEGGPPVARPGAAQRERRHLAHAGRRGRHERDDGHRHPHARAGRPVGQPDARLDGARLHLDGVQGAPGRDHPHLGRHRVQRSEAARRLGVGRPRVPGRHAGDLERPPVDGRHQADHVDPRLGVAARRVGEARHRDQLPRGARGVRQGDRAALDRALEGRRDPEREADHDQQPLDSSTPATPICNTGRGVCVPCAVRNAMLRVCEMASGGRACRNRPDGTLYCGCGSNVDCPAGQMCDLATSQCVAQAPRDAGMPEVDAGQPEVDAGDPFADAGMYDIPPLPEPEPVRLTGDGCACTTGVGASGAAGSSRAFLGALGVAVAAFVRRRRRA